LLSNSQSPLSSPPSANSTVIAIKSTLNLPLQPDRNSPSTLQQIQRSGPSGQPALPPPNLKPPSEFPLRRKRPPPPMPRISTNQNQFLPGFSIAREPSSDTESSRAATSNDGNHKQSGDSSVYRQGFDDSGVNSANSILGAGNSEAVNQALRQLRMGNLTRDFWMKDEVCKDCFLCGSTFSAWRRKHHCSTFDAAILNHLV
jgi:1-phosphatidylinositol-3-phosphate 5-kinase